MKHSSYILLNLNGKHWTCSTPSTCWIRFGSVLQFVLAHCWTLICQCGACWNLRPSSSRYSYRGQLYLGILGTFVPLKALNHCCHLNHWNDCFHSVWHSAFPGSGSMSLSLLSTSDHLVRRLLFASRSCWGLPGREKIKPNFSLIWDYSTYIWPTDSLNRNFWAKILKQCSWGQHLPTHSTAKEKRSSMHWYRNLGVKCWMEGFSATNSSANAPT